MRPFVKVAVAGALFVFMHNATCSDNRPASSLGGECKIFDPPPFVIKGQTKYDQAYIDDQTEAGIASCGWARPKGRPVVTKAVVIKAPPEAAPVLQHKRLRSLLGRRD